MPEVSLVAILDADKEGFLRAERSLIQTIGRAARNVAGKAILYGDRITNSMQKAIDETARRRAKQIEHNEKHGITPQGLNKRITDVMDLGGDPNRKKRREREKEARKVIAMREFKSEKELLAKINAQEKAMYKAAQDLEFEKAASLRDELHELRETLKTYGAG